jgi:hypothetical protein
LLHNTTQRIYKYFTQFTFATHMTSLQVAKLTDTYFHNIFLDFVNANAGAIRDANTHGGGGGGGGGVGGGGVGDAGGRDSGSGSGSSGGGGAISYGRSVSMIVK